jgi:hypothetical protein
MTAARRRRWELGAAADRSSGFGSTAASSAASRADSADAGLPKEARAAASAP